MGIKIFRNILTLMFLGFFLLAGLMLYQAAHPRVDEDFVARLDAAIARSRTDGPVPLSSVMPGDWDTVCGYLFGGPTKVSRDIKDQLGLPEGTKINIVEGSDYITDDESALVFYNSKTLNVWVKFITSHYIRVASEEGCLSGRKDIFLSEIQNENQQSVSTIYKQEEK